MNGQTPQQSSNIKYNVDKLVADKATQVQVPTTKGTFQNTGNGTVDTTTGGWSATSKVENYPVFSVKWGPARKAFTRQGETAQNIVGKSHLYIYFGVDRLFSRDSNQMGTDTASGHGNNMFTYAGIHASYIILYNKWSNNNANWAVPVTPDMYEVNEAMVTGATIDALGYITPPNSHTAYYTGWIETPWSTGDGTQDYEMHASFWRCQDEYNSGTALVLYRGPYGDYPFIGASTGEYMPKVKFMRNNQLVETYLWLTEPLSDPHTVFDQVSMWNAAANGRQDVAIAQGASGGLMIEDDIAFPPALALRPHLFAYNEYYNCMIPSMRVHGGGEWLDDDPESGYVTFPNLRFKGNKLFLKTSTLTLNEIDLIMKGQYSWQNKMTAGTGEVMYTQAMPDLYNHLVDMIFLPEQGLMNPVGRTAVALQDLKCAIHARVLYNRTEGIFVLQFWNLNPSSPSGGTEPSVFSNHTIATDWIPWSELYLPNFKDSANKYEGRTCIFRYNDFVTGAFDYADTIPDTEFSGTLDVRSGLQFYSLMHNNEIDGAGEGCQDYTLPLEIYKFHDLDYKKNEMEDDDQVLIRHPLSGGGATIQYAPMGEIGLPDVDTDVTQMQIDQNSIQWGSWTDEYEDEHKFLQLYAFPDNNRQEVLKKLLYPDTTDVVLRRRYVNDQSENVLEVDYLALQHVLNGIPDTLATNTTLYSLNYHGEDATTGQKVWQLYNFHDQGYQQSVDSLTPGCAQFVVRNQYHGAVTADITYVPVYDIYHKVDSAGVTSKSIELSPSGTPTELRLYDFLGCASTYSSLSQKPTFKTLTDDGYSVLVRDDDDGVGPCLKYFDLRYLSRYSDDDISDPIGGGFNEQSIDTRITSNSMNAPFFQLHDFSQPTVSTVNIQLRYDGCTYHLTNGLQQPEDVQFVMRNARTGKEIQYFDFTITAPTIQASDLPFPDPGGDIQDIYDDIDEIWDYIHNDIEGHYWETGGSSSTCYGSDIGDSNGNSVINLDSKTLDGNWTTDGSHTVNQGLSVVGAAGIGGALSVTGNGHFSNDVVVNSMLQAGCIYAAGPIAITGSGGTLQIGNTTLNETQLQQLLRLI